MRPLGKNRIHSVTFRGEPVDNSAPEREAPGQMSASELRSAGVHVEVFADPIDQQGHLVGDVADVGLRAAEHAQTAAGAGRGDEEHRVVELDHRLAHPAGAEVPS